MTIRPRPLSAQICSWFCTDMESETIPAPNSCSVTSESMEEPKEYYLQVGYEAPRESFPRSPKESEREPGREPGSQPGV